VGVRKPKQHVTTAADALPVCYVQEGGEITMKTSPKMQQVIEQLAKKHQLDLSQVEAHLRLEMPGYQPLVIENIGCQRISVAHYFEQNGDLIADPDVVFFAGYGVWVPMEITQVLGGYRRYAALDEAGQTIVRIDVRGQAALATFSEQWAQNILDQGWLQCGQRSV
jgi:hypothetical protein